MPEAEELSPGIPAYQIGRRLEFYLAGQAQQQGSKSFKGWYRSKVTGRMVPKLPEANPHTQAWKLAVANAAQAAAEDAEWVRLGGPIQLGFVFQTNRPKRHYRTSSRGGQNAIDYSRLKKGAPQFVVGQPDLSHLVRALEDALTMAGNVWGDDKHVAAYGPWAMKVYGTPGLWVRVEELIEVEDEA